jgi:hypothetical protein
LTGTVRNGSDDARRVGQCFDCIHGRRVVSARGSQFWLCERSRTEPERFAKYPPLPVYNCPGFEPKAER